MGRLKRGWQDTDTILAYFGRRRRETLLGYKRFVEQGIKQGKRKELKNMYKLEAKSRERVLNIENSD